MKSRLIFASLLFAAISILSACSNSTDRTTNSDTSQTVSASSDTMQSNNTMQSDTTPMQSSNGLMAAMNNMMRKMKAMKITGDFDIDFATMMIEHHEGAIAMAQVELSQGKDDKMKSKAQEIITKQKDEQQKLRDFVNGYKPSGMKHGQGELQTSMTEMQTKMSSMLMRGDVDKDFAMMMIQHHQDGVSMANEELTNGMSDELKKMAQKIITDQQKDIQEFKSWISAH